MSQSRFDRPTGALKPCPVPGCAAPTKRCYLMCNFHWSKVSLRTQREVYRTLGQIGRGGTAAYLSATERAIAEAQGKFLEPSTRTHSGNPNTSGAVPRGCISTSLDAVQTTAQGARGAGPSPGRP